MINPEDLQYLLNSYINATAKGKHHARTYNNLITALEAYKVFLITSNAKELTIKPQYHGNEVKMEWTPADTEELKHLGIDAEEELLKIFTAEIEKAFEISEESLKNNGWEEWHNPYTGKWTFVKHQQENIEISGVYGYKFEYDLHDNSFRHNGEIVANFNGNIADLETIVKILEL